MEQIILTVKTGLLGFDLPSSLTKRKEVLYKQTSVTISYPGTSCNPPCRTGSAVDIRDNTVLKINHSKSEIADMASIFLTKVSFFKCKQSKVLWAVGQLGYSVHWLFYM